MQEKMEIIIFSQCIMEKGDKPKADAKAKVKKPRVKKAQKQTQKQEQKQSVKIVIAEKVKKPRKRSAPKPKVKVLPVVRGTTTVSEIVRPLIIQQDSDGLAQVITPIRPAPQTQAPPPKPPAPKPPLLSAQQAPTTLGVEMSATSELVYPVEERKKQEPVPKKATKARAKKTFTESIGDFIKKNLLDQPADLQTQEANRPVEMPRPPLIIVPESPPVKPKPKRKGKGITDVPISIQADPKIEQLQMGMEDIDITPLKRKLKKESLDLQGEYDRLEKLIKESRAREYQVLRPTYVSKLSYEEQRKLQKEAEKITDEISGYKLQQLLIQKEMGMPVEKEEILRLQLNQGIISLEEYKKQLGIPDYRKEAEEREKQTPTEATEIVSLQDPDPITKEELNESLRKMIVSDTIDDIIDTIQTPVFSENPDFKTISQNVEIESAPSSMVDYGNEGLTELGVEGFVPVGSVRGMIEEIERKTGGRPRKYDTEEQARTAKREQTLESNRKARAEKKLGSIMERYIKQERLNQEYGQFVSEQEAMDNLTDYLTTGREARRREEEQFAEFDPFKGSAVYIAEEIPAESDFLKNEVGALTRLDNYGKVQIMENDELGYSDETPVLTTALFSTDAVGSNFPVADVEFL